MKVHQKPANWQSWHKTLRLPNQKSFCNFHISADIFIEFIYFTIKRHFSISFVMLLSSSWSFTPKCFFPGNIEQNCDETQQNWTKLGKYFLFSRKIWKKCSTKIRCQNSISPWISNKMIKKKIIKLVTWPVSFGWFNLQLRDEIPAFMLKIYFSKHFFLFSTFKAFEGFCLLLSCFSVCRKLFDGKSCLGNDTDIVYIPNILQRAFRSKRLSSPKEI